MFNHLVEVPYHIEQASVMCTWSGPLHQREPVNHAWFNKELAFAEEPTNSTPHQTSFPDKLNQEQGKIATGKRPEN